MARGPAAFPPDVAAALQRPSGHVTVHYTAPAKLTGPPAMDMALMSTPWEEVLAALVLDTKLNLRFIRTGSRREGARRALVDVAALVGTVRHWDIELIWDEEHLSVAAHARDLGGP